MPLRRLGEILILNEEYNNPAVDNAAAEKHS